MRIVNEEAFGPVMLILKWKTDAEVIEYANATGQSASQPVLFLLSLTHTLSLTVATATEYGLSSSIFSTNYKRAEAMGREIIAGSVASTLFFIFSSISLMSFRLLDNHQ